MLRDHDPGETYSEYHSTYLRRSSPPGSPAIKRCCYDHKKYNKPNEPSFFCCCYSCTGNRSTSILATLGVCCLVLGYTIVGAFIFMSLEGGLQQDTAVAASKSNPKGDSSIIGDLRTDTVDRLWSITENLNILYRENWTRLAAEEVLLFQEALFKVLKNSESGYISSSEGTMPFHHSFHKWSFSSSFLYSLTLITTIGCMKDRLFKEKSENFTFKKVIKIALNKEASSQRSQCECELSPEQKEYHLESRKYSGTIEERRLESSSRPPQRGRSNFSKTSVPTAAETEKTLCEVCGEVHPPP
nr:uncharacterized protein LOC111508611 [Leptinotarsa decemlineata]